MISLRSHGSFDNFERWLRRAEAMRMRSVLERYAQEGVAALAAATPKGETGLAASSWDYVIEESRDSVAIIWTNDNHEDGFRVAIRLQYGYGTGTGGYVQGVDYINPAIKPVFDRIGNGVWKVVTA
jgi:hypothetical protein